MIKQIGVRWIVLLCMMPAALISCATVREKTESYILADEPPLTRPMDAWLRTLEIVSDNLPLSEDYALIRDSLAAIASRHGFLLSSMQASQPYVFDLVVHERSYAVDLESKSSVMAVLNVTSSSDGIHPKARVVYSAVTGDSIVSLYQVGEVAEKIFSSLAATLADGEAKAKSKALADARAGSAP